MDRLVLRKLASSFCLLFAREGIKLLALLFTQTECPLPAVHGQRGSVTMSERRQPAVWSWGDRRVGQVS